MVFLTIHKKCLFRFNVRIRCFYSYGLVFSALDLQVENDMEREEALQLIFHIMNIYKNSHLKRLIEFSASQQDGKYVSPFFLWFLNNFRYALSPKTYYLSYREILAFVLL